MGYAPDLYKCINSVTITVNTEEWGRNRNTMYKRARIAFAKSTREAHVRRVLLTCTRLPWIRVIHAVYFVFAFYRLDDKCAIRNTR